MAFYYCNNLKDVYYGGTEAQWEKIKIENTDNGNDPLLSATVHCNAGPTPQPPQTFSVTYDTAGGSVSLGTLPPVQSYESGATVKIPSTLECLPVREGYTFAGWSNGTTTYLPVLTGTQFIMPSHNIVLTAQWTKDSTPVQTYTVSYNLNTIPIEAEIKGTIPQPQTYEKGQTVTVTSANIVWTGYKFTGWTDGTHTYAPGSTFVMPEHDVRLNALIDKDIANADIHKEEVFLKQPNNNLQCTLYANTMMLRRKAILEGKTDWKNISIKKPS